MVSQLTIQQLKRSLYLAVTFLLIGCMNLSSETSDRMQTCHEFIFSSTDNADDFFGFGSDLSIPPTVYTKVFSDHDNLPSSCMSWKNHVGVLNGLEPSLHGAFLASEQYAYILNAGDPYLPLDMNSYLEINEYFDSLSVEATLYFINGTVQILSNNYQGEGLDYHMICRDMGFLMSLSSNMHIDFQEQVISDQYAAPMYKFIHFCEGGRWKFPAKKNSRDFLKREAIATAYSNEFANYYYNGTGFSDEVREKARESAYEYALSTTDEVCPETLEIISNDGFCYLYLVK